MSSPWVIPLLCLWQSLKYLSCFESHSSQCHERERKYNVVPSLGNWTVSQCPTTQYGVLTVSRDVPCIALDSSLTCCGRNKLGANLPHDGGKGGKEGGERKKGEVFSFIKGPHRAPVQS